MQEKIKKVTMGQHVNVIVDGAPKEVSQGVVIVQEDQEETMVVVSHFGDQLLMSLENWRMLMALYHKAIYEFNENEDKRS